MVLVINVFKKIRITNKSNIKIKPDDEVQQCLQTRTKLQVFVHYAKSSLGKKLAEEIFFGHESVKIELSKKCSPN